MWWCLLLERSQHMQLIKILFPHLPNGLCFVLTSRIVGCHSSLDDLLERKQRLAHCSYRVPHLCCPAFLKKRLFYVEWFQCSPGKRCDVMGHCTLVTNIQMESWKCQCVGCHVCRWCTASGGVLDSDVPSRWMTIPWVRWGMIVAWNVPSSSLLFRTTICHEMHVKFEKHPYKFFMSLQTAVSCGQLKAHIWTMW